MRKPEANGENATKIEVTRTCISDELPSIATHRRPEGTSPLDLNHSPEQTIDILLEKTWRYAGRAIREDTKWLIDEASPTRDLKGGTANDEFKGDDEFIDDLKENDDRTFRQESSWRALPASSDAQVAPTAGITPWIMSRPQIDGSNSSTATSDKSEREREQLIHARQLVMQQGFSSMVMPGRNACSPSHVKLNSLGSSSMSSSFTGTQSQPSLYGTPLAWSIGPLPNASYGSPDINSNNYSKSTNPSALDDFVPILHGRQAYGTALNNVMPPYMPQSRNHLSTGQDLLGMSYERNIQAPPFTSDTNAGVISSYGSGMQRSYLQSNQRQNLMLPQAGAGSSSGAERRPNLNFNSTSYPGLSTLQFGGVGPEFSNTPAGGQGEASQQFSLPSLGGFQLLSSSSTSSLPTDVFKVGMPGSSPEFMPSSVEGLAWLNMNQKPAPTMSPLANEDFSLALGHDTMASEASLVNQSRITGPTPSSSATGIGQLPLLNIAGENSGRLRDIVGAGTSSLTFGIDYNPAAEIESKYNQGMPKVSG
eukprot:Gb_10923 [translate_table: standard]